MTTSLVQSIAAVTHVVPDLDAIEAAYTRWLEYRVLARGAVDAATARCWSAPAMAGRRLLLLAPASGEPVYLRFVEALALQGTQALRTLGWNATEILVQDPDALAVRLADSPFRVVGPPANLAYNEHIRALQAVGPAGEFLYLTRIPPGKSLFDLGSATTFVDRVFIVVAGGRDAAAMLAFYRDVLGMAVTAPRPTTVGVLNEAWSLPAGHETLLGIARFPRSFLVEVDEYPPGAGPRPQRACELPPGMALVSLVAPDLEPLRERALAPPEALHAAPYDGRRALTLRGAAGELIELVEARR